MSFTPRFFQQEAHDAVIEHWKKSTLPILVEAATGAGKSWIIAMIASTIVKLSGKKTLVTQPSKELVEQNSEKYGLLGMPYSVFSASINKSLRENVIFATEGTFKKVAKRMGKEFGAVINDEAHRITPTLIQIIDDLRLGNPNLRVCGLTATPYRLGEGFIFGIDPEGRAMPPALAREPYYHKLVYHVSARQLIDLGYLTPIIVKPINAAAYDTSALKILPNGSFSPKTFNATFEGWGRETSLIVADFVSQTPDRKGVMIFAATVKHAQEIMASLPPENSRMIGGEFNTKKKEREALVRDFKAKKFKYLVSVGTMTTGVDFTHVDVVVLMRAMESVSLMQQMMGRGMRLDPDKVDCWMFDYGGNIERLCPDGDIYKPEIKAQYQSAGEGIADFKCEECNGVNSFSLRKNDDGLEWDEYGYFVDLTGERILVQDNKGDDRPLPAHYGRRCNHSDRYGNRCSYYWSSKLCPVCEHHNDIAARYCESCKAELINPNDKLIATHKQYKRDPTQPQSETVVSMTHSFGVSMAGNEQLTVEFLTSHRRFKVYYGTSPERQWQYTQYRNFMNATAELTVTPDTVTYKKEDSGFFKILGFNQPTDEQLLREKIGNEISI